MAVPGSGWQKGPFDLLAGMHAMKAPALLSPVTVATGGATVDVAVAPSVMNTWGSTAMRDSGVADAVDVIVVALPSAFTETHGAAMLAT